MNEEACAKCPSTQQVLWCPAWQEYLCAEHRHQRTYKELDATEKPPEWAWAAVQPVTVRII